jgi:DNA-binding transcriptional MerR regulator
VGGHRHYTEDEADRVLYLQRLYAAGLTSQTIRTVLPCVQSPSLANIDAAFATLIKERDKLAAHIADLAHTLASLDDLITDNHTRRAAPVADAGAPLTGPRMIVTRAR